VRIVLATRRSPLALAQTEAVAGALRAAGHEPELLGLTTTGDRWSAAGTGAAPDKGLFVKELEEALGDGRADLAVHSAKDLPAELPDGLAVVAVPPREDARDVLVGPPGGLAALPAGARVATGSPRRAAQVLAARPDLLIVPIRGNVGTRLDKLARGDADALVLAAAGLARLGLAPGGAEPLPIEVSTPAPGQGLLAIEARAGGPAAIAAAAALDDPLAHACLRAERAVLAGLGGGCLQPVGAFCRPRGAGLRLTAFAGAADGTRAQRVEVDGDADAAEALGAEAAGLLAAVRR
jgi:hydroxymethylbilane synthase